MFLGTNNLPRLESVRVTKVFDRHFDGKMKQIEQNDYEFEYRGMSGLVATFRVSGPSVLQCRLRNQPLLIQKSRHV